MKNYPVILLLLFYLLLLLSYFVFMGIFHPTDYHTLTHTDAESYIDATRMMLNSHNVHPLRCLGYSTFLSVPYLLFKTSSLFFWCVNVMQVILLFCTFYLIFKILKYYNTVHFALGIVIVLMCNISYFSYSFHIATEIPFLFLMTTSFYYLHLHLTTAKPQSLLLAFLFICLATLFRPVTLYMCLSALLLLSIYLLFYKKKPVQFVKLCIIFLFTIGLQFLVMHQKYQQWKISYIDDITLYRYMNTSVEAKIQGTDKLALMKLRDIRLNNLTTGLSDLQSYKLQHKTAINETKLLLSKYPCTFIAAYTENLFSNFHTGNAFIRDTPPEKMPQPMLKKTLFDFTRIWNMTFVIGLLLLNLAYMISLVLKKTTFKNLNLFHCVLLFYADYIFFTSGITYFQGDRLNIVWMPMLIIFIFSKSGLFHPGTFFNSKSITGSVVDKTADNAQ